MDMYSIEKTTLQKIANAIRSVNGEAEHYTPNEMVDAIINLDTSVATFFDENAITEEVNGAVINMVDASNLPLRSLILYGKTVQAGTPTIETPAELNSAGSNGSIGVYVSGKNLAMPNTVEASSNGYTVITNTDGTVTVTGSLASSSTASCHLALFAGGSTFNPVRLQAGTDYVLRVTKNGATCSNVGIRVRYLDDDTVIYGSLGDKLRERQIERIYVQQNAGGTVGSTHLCGTYTVQLEKGTVSTAFEPYKALQTLSISTPNGLPGIPVASGGNYTDENGQQWLCDEIDFTRGVRIKRTGGGRITNDFTFLRTEPMTDAKAQYRTQITIPVDWKNSINYTAGNVTGLFSHGNYIHAWTGTQTYVYVQANSLILSLPASCGTTVEEVKAYITQQEENGTPLEVLYPLATPIETPISEEEMVGYHALHTYKPYTTIFNDAGSEQSLAYIVDTKTYVDRATG